MSVCSLFVEQRYISNCLVTNDQVIHGFFSSNLFGKKEGRIPAYSELYRIIHIGRCNLIDPAILHENSDLLAKR